MTIHHWTQLPEAEQRRVVQLMARMIGAKDLDALRRVFDLCEPAIEMGEENGRPVTRVANPHLAPLRLLIDAYVPYTVPTS